MGREAIPPNLLAIVGSTHPIVSLLPGHGLKAAGVPLRSLNVEIWLFRFGLIFHERSESKGLPAGPLMPGGDVGRGLLLKPPNVGSMVHTK